MYYKIYGLFIESDYRLEEAVEITENQMEKADITIRKKELDNKLTVETEIDDKCESGILYRNQKEWGCIRAKGQGCFLMEKGNSITYQLKEGYNPLIVNQLILCAAIPILLIQRGVIAIHGSGILWGEKAVIVSGVSGSGKSTLTAGLLENGGVFMADDTVALEEKEGKIFAQPSYPQQKLCTDAVNEKIKSKAELVLLPPDGKTEKYAVRLKERFCTEEKELAGIVILNAEDVEKVELKEIRGNEKIKYLLNNIYKYKTYLQVGMPPEVFKKCIEIADKVKIYVLTRPKEGMTVEEQINKLKGELERE